MEMVSKSAIKRAHCGGLRPHKFSASCPFVFMRQKLRSSVRPSPDSKVARRILFFLLKSFQGAAFIWARMKFGEDEKRWKHRRFLNRWLFQKLFYCPAMLSFSCWYSHLKHCLSSVLVFCLALLTDANTGLINCSFKPLFPGLMA